MRGLGTVLNVVTVALGTTIGVLFGARVPERFRTTVMQGIGLVVLALGVIETRDTRNAVFVLASLLVGGLIGEALRLEDRLASAGRAIQRRVGERSASPGSRARFVEGFRISSIVFCVGPLTVLGSIQDGLRGHIDLLATKSLLDGFAALAFATTYGWGVAASIVTIVVVQGGITAAAAGLHHVLNSRMVDEMSAVGGVMLVGIGVRLLDIKEIRVASFLPALVIAPVLVAIFAR
ncbi:MAG: hypothetical protein JWL83_483 [Actinomycetia bacterium]|nr:hypothetical protein [Actinomycetes bacterium]